MADLRQRIAPAVFLRWIERQCAVRRRMHVVVGADARCAARGALAPVLQQRVSRQQLAFGVLQPRIASGGALPHAQIVADKRHIRRAPEELPRDQAVLLVHAGIERGVELDLRADEGVAVHVLADQARTDWRRRTTAAGAGTRHSPRRARRSSPGSPSPQPSRARPPSPRRCACRRTGDQPPHERLVVQRDLLRGEQRLEREVRRIARARRADLARVAAQARRPAAVGARVLGLRRALETECRSSRPTPSAPPGCRTSGIGAIG